MTRIAALSAIVVLCAACTHPPAREAYTVVEILDGLNNPSCVSFHPDGMLTVCDSGNGQVVILWSKDTPSPFPVRFETEHWKVDGKTGVKRFKLGPLSALWLDHATLVVTDGGKKDGKETVNFYNFVEKHAREPERSNPVGPTSKDAKDKGEGNLTGMCLSPDKRTLYVCGQGSDAKTWVLKCDVATRKLEPFLSADDNGIEVNSPMQALMRGDDRLLVLYSGAGGKDDGLIVEWNLKTKKPAAQWKLPGLIDPMGMVFLPGSTDEVAVVDNNWALTKVNRGRIARVKLLPGGKTDITVIATDVKGPVSCVFGPDGRLYVALLGEEFDKGLGRVIAVSGF
ncbi:MAG: hypothetical protein ACYTAF_08450 [Planctomycetota bacterium]|jgi:hypothetical protein